MKSVADEVRSASNVLLRLAADLHCQRQLELMIDSCVSAMRSGRKLLLAGNGGSAADAQHWAGELVSRFYYDRPGLPAIALTTDTSIITATANDYSFDYVFARQIEAIGVAGDVFLGISTSGKSASILRALTAARDRGIVTLGFTGQNGSEMAKLCDHCVMAPADITPRIQECHAILGHTLCAGIESAMFPRGATGAPERR